jgi:hypothetical protein
VEYTDKMRRPIQKVFAHTYPEAYGLDAAESRRLKKQAEETGRIRRTLAKAREELAHKRQTKQDS